METKMFTSILAIRGDFWSLEQVIIHLFSEGITSDTFFRSSCLHRIEDCWFG